MNAERLEHFRQLLMQQLQEHVPHVREDLAAAREMSDGGVKDSLDFSVLDVSEELILRLGEREYELIADIDQALLRMREGSYGRCARCSRPIDERRLEALPTARYDAACQALIENSHGASHTPTL